ncbi:MAG: endonuclease [Bacteroidales bacterium]|nr:endonuclease [Bacteroidales bacterium]
MARHNELGKWGENIAMELLVTQGYAIRETNWHMGNKEVDIIAQKDNFIVFVEVKTRGTDFVDPVSAVNRRRMMRMVSAADCYMRAKDLPHDVRFDIISIIGNPDSGTPPQVEHIVDAFLPPLRSVR